MTPDETCREKAAKSGSSFYYSFLFLPPAKRRALTALYAFCRIVDDIADECGDTALARAQLDAWHKEIERIFEGCPEHPVAQALTSAVREFNLPEKEFHEIIEGMEMDLTRHRYANFDALQVYCHHVAGVVGQLSARIFGYQDARTARFAHDLGLAFQLTNILRDVGEDASRGRIYLPRDELARFGVSETELLQGRQTENLTRCLAFQAERARHYYEKALDELPPADRKNQRVSLVMAAIYRALLDKIEQNGYRVLSGRTRLSAFQKLWIALRTWLHG